MKEKWIKFIRESTKQSFKLLRKDSPIFCPLLRTDIIISKKFFNHIAHAKRRKENIEEQLERLLIVPFVMDIITTGICTKIKRELHKIFFRLEKEYKNNILVLIIEKKEGKFRLLSCFKSHNKKELVSVSIDPSLTEK